MKKKLQSSIAVNAAVYDLVEKEEAKATEPDKVMKSEIKKKRKMERFPSSQNQVHNVNFIKPGDISNNLELIKENHKLGDFLETDLSEDDISDD